MPTFTETKTLKSIKLVPESDIIITEHEVATLKDGVVITKATEGRSYSNMQIADFEMDIAPTGGSLLSIVEAFNAAAQTAKDEALIALTASEAKVAQLQAQIDAYTPPTPTVDVNRIEALNGLLMLDQAGLGAAYTAWATSPDRTFAQRAFIDKAIYWRREDPTLAAAAAAFGLTSEQVDALFAQASLVQIQGESRR